jgi:hypothetical protein
MIFKQEFTLVIECAESKYFPLISQKERVKAKWPTISYFFNIVMDMMVFVIARAKEGGQICGVVLRLIEDGLSTCNTQMPLFYF